MLSCHGYLFQKNVYHFSIVVWLLYICWPAPSNLYTVYMAEIANENELLFQREVGGVE